MPVLGVQQARAPVPQFEVTSRTVELLHQLVEASEVRCRDTGLLMEDLGLKAAEYHADGVYLQDVVLQGVGVSVASVSKSVAEYVSALVENAVVLGVRDTSLSSFVPAMNHLTNKVLEAEKTERRLDRELKALRRKLGATLVLRKNLQEDINKTTRDQDVRAAQAEQRLLRMDFVRTKSRELINRRKVAEDQISSRNMNPRLNHQALMEMFEEITNLRQETILLTKKLEPYLDLSPNPSLAQVHVEEAKRELAALDAKLELTLKNKAL